MYRPGRKAWKELQNLKIFLQNMPNYKDDIVNIISIKKSIEQIEKLCVDSAAELYPPIDAIKLQQQSQDLFNAVKTLNELLVQDENESAVEGLILSLEPVTKWIAKEEPWNLNNALFDIASVMGFTREAVVHSLASNGQNVEDAAQVLFKSVETNLKI